MEKVGKIIRRTGVLEGVKNIVGRVFLEDRVRKGRFSRTKMGKD